MAELENPFEGDSAAPVEEQKPIEEATAEAPVAPVEHARDAAVAVRLADLEALIEHALKTGGEDLAARFRL